MSDQEVTLGQLLSVPLDQQSVGGSGSRATEGMTKFKERVKAEVKTIHWPASMPDLVEKVTQLLDIPLPDIMIEAWRKSEEIQEALEESRKSPQEERFVELVEHTLSTEFRPKIEIHIGRTLAKTIEFLVEVSLTLKGAELHIQGGEVRAIRAGSCEAEGTMKYQELTIAEKKLGTLLLPEVMLVGRS